MYTQNIETALIRLYGQRKYTAQEVSKIIDTLCGGLTVCPAKVIVAGRTYSLPSDVSKVAEICSCYPQWCKLETVLCGAIMAACDMERPVFSHGPFTCNYIGVRWLSKHKGLTPADLLRAVSCLLDYTPGKIKQEPENQTITALQLALQPELPL